MDQLLKCFDCIIAGNGDFAFSEDYKKLKYSVNGQVIDITKAITECNFSKLDVDQVKQDKYIRYKKKDLKTSLINIDVETYIQNESFYVYKEDYRKYTEAELIATAIYTREEFEPINGLMRGDYTAFMPTKFMNHDLKQIYLDAIILASSLNKHQMPEDLASKTVLVRLEDPKRLESIEKGDEFTQFGFLSTTSLTVTNTYELPVPWYNNFLSNGTQPKRLIVFKGFNSTPVALCSKFPNEEEMLGQHGQFMKCVYNRKTGFYSNEKALVPYELTVITQPNEEDSEETKRFVEQIAKFKTAQGVYHFLCNANTHLADEKLRAKALADSECKNIKHEKFYNPYKAEPDDLVVPETIEQQDILQPQVQPRPQTVKPPDTNLPTNNDGSNTGAVIVISIVLAAVVAYAVGIKFNAASNLMKNFFAKSRPHTPN